MRLAVFRSLTARGPQKLPALLLRGSNVFDGVELSLDQLIGDQPGLIGDRVRVICRVEPTDAADALRKLDQLSDYISRADAQPVELISLKAPTMSFDAHLEYLSHVLPVAAKFLELHPTVGSQHGKVTGHGRPVPMHVLGTCHELAGSVAALSEVCDVYPPTRLSLSHANLHHGDDARPLGSGGGNNENDFDGQQATGAAIAAPPASGVGGVSDELHTVLLCADHLVIHSELEADRIGSLWEEVRRFPALAIRHATIEPRCNVPSLMSARPGCPQVWCAQQLEGARETYASVRVGPSCVMDVTGSQVLDAQGHATAPSEGDASASSRCAASAWAAGLDAAAADQLGRAEETLVACLRERFARSSSWREGAATRRQAEDEQAARVAKRAALSSVDGPLAEAAASFGLNLFDDAESTLNVGKVKQRWRELAFERHPDVAANCGSSESFLRLKRHYQVLLQACSS